MTTNGTSNYTWNVQKPKRIRAQWSFLRSCPGVLGRHKCVLINNQGTFTTFGAGVCATREKRFQDERLQM